MQRPRVLAIVGLTGTGKSDLAVEVARRTGAEIISVDSMQVYRGFDIGTAKPPREVQAEIPHHLIDVATPDEPMTAGRYAEIARAAAHDIAARGRPVVLCGGTGLYARAFAGGLAPELGSSEALRAELRQRALDDLYAELQRTDPESARSIAPRDRVRIERALEAQRISGRPASKSRSAHAFLDRPFEIEWLALDLERAQLELRLAARVDAMLAAGWIEEVRELRRMHGPDVRPLQAIGYREIGALLEGRLSEAETRTRILVSTRRYAKRQRTWFRSEPGVRWIDAAQPERALEAALAASSH